jgi:hypothetical protein
MKNLAGFIISIAVLGFTTCLVLVNPLVYGFGYGVKKGWIKPRPRR